MSVEFFQSQQALNYGNVAICALAVYDLVVYFDQEVEFIWKRDESMLSKCLYATMRYCGLLYAIYGVVPIGQWDVSPQSWYGICYSGIVITITANYAVSFALDATMSLRVYALYGQSKTVIVILSIFFAISQGVVLVSQFVPYMPYMQIIGVQPGIPGGSYCIRAVNYGWILIAGNAAGCAYEILLVGMVICRFWGHVMEYRKETLRSLKGFLGIIVRDNIIYFIIITISVVLSACSYLPAYMNGDPSSVLPFNLVTVLFAGAINCVLGPHLMFSIRQYDASLIKGGTSQGSGVGSLQFAVDQNFGDPEATIGVVSDC